MWNPNSGNKWNIFFIVSCFLSINTLIAFSEVLCSFSKGIHYCPVNVDN